MPIDDRPLDHQLEEVMNELLPYPDADVIHIDDIDMFYWNVESDIDVLKIICNNYFNDPRTWASIRCSSKELSTYTNLPVFARLLLHQKSHTYKLLYALHKFGRAMDTSMMGRGKSFTSVALAAALELPVVVFAPGSSRYNWDEAFKHFDMKRGSFYPYSVFQRKHPPFYKRRELPPAIPNAPKPSVREKFELTDEWREICAAGVLLVIDEVHFVKNKNARHHLLVSMIREMFCYAGSSSKLLCLSGTPFVRSDETQHLARVMCLYRTDPLSQMHPLTGQLEYLGLQEFLEFCERVDPSFDSDVLEYTPSEDFTANVIHTCMMKSIKPALIFSMPKAESQPGRVPLYTANLKFDGEIDPLYSRRIQSGLARIGQALGMLAARIHVAQAQAILTSGMRELETGKIPCFQQTAELLLQRSGNSKVVIMCNNIETIDTLAENLQHYTPIVIKGSVKPEKRPGLVQLFQRPTPEYRLLISTMSLLANGVDLDDQHGEFPRSMILSPSYHFTVLRQAQQRIDRTYTRSAASAYHLYSNESSEVKILENIDRKRKMLGQITDNDEYLDVQETISFSSL